MCKDIGPGVVAARPVGNVFYDRGFADVFLRHLMQTGGSHPHDDEPFAVRHANARLPARSHAPGAPEDDVACGGGHRPQSRRFTVEVRIVRRPSVSGRLPRAERGRHHEDRPWVSTGATRGRP